MHVHLANLHCNGRITRPSCRLEIRLETTNHKIMLTTCKCQFNVLQRGQQKPASETQPQRQHRKPVQQVNAAAQAERPHM